MKVFIDSIEADKPNANGRVYSSSIVQETIRQYNEQIKNNKCFVLIDTPTDDMIPLDKIGGIVEKCWLEDNKIALEIKSLQSPNGQVLSDMLSGGAKVYTNVIGKLEKDKTVSDVTAISFSLGSSND